VRILGYHRVCHAPADELAVPPERFRAQLEQALESGARPLRLRDAVDKLGEPVEGRWLCVTFDDGYRDCLENAAPILAEMMVPATVFLATDIIEGASTFRWYEDPPPALGWDEVRTLQGGGLVEFGSHTRTHPKLPDLNDAQAWAEVDGSRRVLSRRLGCSVTGFCYPAGRCSDRDAALVAQAGYRFAVTATPGVNSGGESPFLLRRSMVGRDVDQLRFVALMDGLLDDVDPLPALLRRLGLLHQR
jgi:peptidoglycan/xylan/chitin deacetylase (PgdA/CDA1 family)